MTTELTPVVNSFEKLENETFEVDVTAEMESRNSGWVDWDGRIIYIGIPLTEDIPTTGLEHINMPKGIDVFKFLDLNSSFENNATALANWSVALRKSNENYGKISNAVQVIITFLISYVAENSTVCRYQDSTQFLLFMINRDTDIDTYLVLKSNMDYRDYLPI